MLKHIIAREFKVLLNTKAQIIGTIITFCMIVGGGLVGAFFINKQAEEIANPAPSVVAVSEQMEEFAQVLDGTGAIETEIISHQADYAKWLKGEAEKDPQGPTIVLDGTPDKPEIIQYGEGHTNNQTVAAIKQALMLNKVDTIAGGITTEEASSVLTTLNVPVKTVTGSSNLVEENPTSFITAMVAQVLLFFAVVTGVSTLATGVVEEKSSRVVEILLSSVRPRTLLLGKILGIGAFVLTQIMLYIVAAIITLNVAGLWKFVSFNTIIFWMIAWVLIGFFTYATVTGGVSAMVSRQEDLGGVLAPITFSMLIPFYCGLFLVPAAPDSIWTKVLSLIPGFSSFIMPVRQAYNSVESWELYLALAIGVISVPLFATLAGKIYENSILRMGKRVKLSQALFGR